MPSKHLPISHTPWVQPPPPHTHTTTTTTTTTTKNHHHTVGRKTPLVQVESVCEHLREKHDHRKLLSVTTTVRTRHKGQDARCKSQDQHQHILHWDAATKCNSNYHHHRPAQDQHWCWCSARCSNHCKLCELCTNCLG